MQRAIRSIIPALPEGSSVFLFGSALRSSQFSDVDMLILYDPTLCAPDRAHSEHKGFVDGIAKDIDVPIHLCLLTYQEERTTGFIAQVSAEALWKPGMK